MTEIGLHLSPLLFLFRAVYASFCAFLERTLRFLYAFFRLSLNSSSACALTHLSAYARATRILAHLHINAPLHSFRGARKGYRLNYLNLCAALFAQLAI